MGTLMVRLLATLLPKSNLIRKGTGRVEKKDGHITGPVTRTVPRSKEAFGHSGKRVQSSPSPLIRKGKERIEKK